MRVSDKALAWAIKYERFDNSGNAWLDLRDTREALRAVLADIADYEKVNHLHPNPGHEDCWQSVTNAKRVLE